MNKDKKEKLLLPACSCMTLTSKSGKHYWFRTCDIETDIWSNGAHVTEQERGREIIYCDGKREYSKYSFIGMTYNALDTWILDGVNECGLAGGLLLLYEGTSVEKAEEGQIGYVGMELVTKMLSSCKDIDDVMELVKQVQILHIPVGEEEVEAAMHYFFVDKKGNELILEAADKAQPGRLKEYKKGETLGVMTNSPPYQEQLQNLAWFLSQSWEMKQDLNGQAITEIFLDGRSVKADENAKHLSLTGTFPASYSSYDRFIRLSVLKYLNDSGNCFEDEKMLALGSGIMNTVCEPHTKGIFHYTKMDSDGKIVGQKDSYTQYLSMYDMEEKVFFQKMHDRISWEKYAL